MKNKLLILAFVVATLSIAGSLIASGHTFALPSSVLSALRWVAIALFAADATVRRSLTAWIFVGLFAGAELGYDAPAFCGQAAISGEYFPAADQSDHRAAAVWNPGYGDRWAREPEKGRAARLEVPGVFRGGVDDRAVDRVG